jgi:hypothetical protein
MMNNIVPHKNHQLGEDMHVFIGEEAMFRRP